MLIRPFIGRVARRGKAPSVPMETFASRASSAMASDRVTEEMSIARRELSRASARVGQAISASVVRQLQPHELRQVPNR